MYIKYYESGYVPIPIRPNSKLPAVKGFNEWASEGIARSLVEGFEENFPIEKGYGIGIVCGRASNLCVLDIDTDDPSILSALSPSPVRRRGKKGEARFFQFNPDLTNRSFTRKGDDGKIIAGLDVLVDRKYIIVPPSIHPETRKPYIWLTPDGILDIASGDLPNLLPEDMDTAANTFGYDSDFQGGTVDLTGSYASPDGKRSPHGSYNRLKALACGFVSERMDLSVAVGKLLKFDDDHHGQIGYFKDARSHADFGADPYSNAARFYCQILKTVNQTRIRHGKQPQVPLERAPVLQLDAATLQANPVSQGNFVRYPEPRGLIKDFVDYCELAGNGRQDALGLGGGLALVAILSSNRYVSKVKHFQVTPNVYILNLGYSGFGKDVSQRLLDDLLGDTELIGSSNYRSSSAIIHDLAERQERLDIMDEMSGLLLAMNSHEYYQKEMVEVLSTLYSKAATRYNGISSIQHGARQGACWNPHVSIFGSTTPTGFKESVNASMAAKGLMPRFITLFQKEIGDYREGTDEKTMSEIKARLAQAVAHHLSVNKVFHPSFTPPINPMAKRESKAREDRNLGARYKPIRIPFEPSTQRQWIAYAKQCHQEAAPKPEDYESAFIQRWPELAAKVALLDAISLGRGRIDGDSLEWAIEVVETCWRNSKELFRLTSSKNSLEAAHQEVLQIITSHGTPIGKRDLTRKTQWLNDKTRKEILKALEESDTIKECVLKEPKGQLKTYYATWDVAMKVSTVSQGDLTSG